MALLVLSFISQTRTQALIYSAYFAVLPLFLVAGSYKTINYSLLYKVIRAIAYIISAYCLLQFAFTNQRANFLVIDPNFIGGVIAFVFVGESLCLLQRYKPNIKPGYLPLLLLSLGMGATQSRSVLFLSLTVIALVFLFFSSITAKTRLRTFLNIIFIYVIAWGFVSLLGMFAESNSIIAERVSTGGNSLQARFEIWASTLQMFFDKPLLGHGFGSFAAVYPEYRTEISTVGTFAHNDLLQIFAETGIFVGSFYAFVFIFFVWGLIKNIKDHVNTNKTAESDLAIVALQAGALFLLLQSCVNFNFYIGASSLLLSIGFCAMCCQLFTPGKHDLIKPAEPIKKLKITTQALVFGVVAFYLYFILSILFTSYIADEGYGYTRRLQNLPHKLVIDLEEALNAYPLVSRPVVPLAEDIILLAGTSKDEAQRQILKQRAIKYYRISQQHKNYECINGMLAAVLAEEFPGDPDLPINKAREDILEQLFNKLPKCRVYYEFVLAK